MSWLLLGGMGVIALILLIYASTVLMLVFGAPWVPTSSQVAMEILRMAEVERGETVLDLGCGHGVIAIFAAKQFGAKSIGIDIHPALILWARYRAFIRGVSMKTTFLRQNILKGTLPDVDIVTMYLLDGLVRELRPILVRDLDPETRIVSHGFPFADVKAREIRHVGSATLYLYKVKDLK